MIANRECLLTRLGNRATVQWSRETADKQGEKRMTHPLTAAIAASLLGSVPATAQTPPPAPIAAAPTNVAVLRTGTEVPLRTSELLTTKNKALKIGQRIRLETASNVLVNDVVVVPAGTPVVGEITDVRNQGSWGKSGHFGARILHMTVNGRQVRMSGAFDDKGTAGGIGAVAAASVFLPAGFLVKGTSAKVEVGTPVKGFVDEDVPLAMVAASSTPMEVRVGAPTPSTVAVANPGTSNTK